MQLALQASGRTYAEILEWARWAEQRGLAAFGIPDHYLGRSPEDPSLDALSVVSGLARDTNSIELTLLVSPVTWRHPAVLAKTYATVADMSGERLVLGVGTGWMEREHLQFGVPFPEVGTRFEMLEEALGYLRAAYAEPPRSFEGDHFAFEAFDMQPRPELRLLVGGMGSTRTPRLAGAYADEFNGYPAPEADYRAKVERARRAAAEAGRDPDALVVSSSGVMIAGDTDSQYRARLERFAARLGAEPDAVADGLAERRAPHGTWDAVRDTLAALERAGMQKFWVQAFGDEPDDLDRALERLRG